MKRSVRESKVEQRKGSRTAMPSSELLVNDEFERSVFGWEDGRLEGDGLLPAALTGVGKATGNAHGCSRGRK
jgi:hypothetical protein